MDNENKQEEAFGGFEIESDIFSETPSVEETPEEVEIQEEETPEEKTAEETEENNQEETQEEQETQEIQEIQEEEEEEDDMSPEDYSTLLKNNFEILKEKGVFQALPEDYKFDPTDEGFEKALNDSAQEYMNYIHEQYKSQLQGNPKAMELLDYVVQTGGKDLDKWVEFSSKEFYTDEDIESNEAIAKQIVQKHLMENNGFDKQEAIDHVNELSDLGSLSKHAIKYNSVNRQKSEKEKERFMQEAAKRKDETVKVIKQELEKTKIPTNKQKQIQRALFETQKFDETVDTEFNYKLKNILNNPAALIELANIVLEYDDKEGLKLQQVFDKTSVSKSTTNFRKKLKEGKSVLLKSKATGRTRRKGDPDISDLTLAI